MESTDIHEKCFSAVKVPQSFVGKSIPIPETNLQVNEDFDKHNSTHASLNLPEVTWSAPRMTDSKASSRMGRSNIQQGMPYTSVFAISRDSCSNKHIDWTPPDILNDETQLLESLRGNPSTFYNPLADPLLSLTFHSNYQTMEEMYTQIEHEKSAEEYGVSLEPSIQEQILSILPWQPSLRAMEKLNPSAMMHFRHKRAFTIFAKAVELYKEENGKDYVHTVPIAGNSPQWLDAKAEAEDIVWGQYECDEIFEDLMRQLDLLDCKKDLELVRKVKSVAQEIAAGMKKQRDCIKSHAERYEAVFKQTLSHFVRETNKRGTKVRPWLKAQLERKAHEVTEISLRVDGEKRRILGNMVQRYTCLGSTLTDELLRNLENAAEQQARQSANSLFAKRSIVANTLTGNHLPPSVLDMAPGQIWPTAMTDVGALSTERPALINGNSFSMSPKENDAEVEGETKSSNSFGLAFPSAFSSPLTFDKQLLQHPMAFEQTSDRMRDQERKTDMSHLNASLDPFLDLQHAEQDIATRHENLGLNSCNTAVAVSSSDDAYADQHADKLPTD